jgi:hypothetical protein
MSIFNKYNNKYLINKGEFKKHGMEFNLDKNKYPTFVLYIDGLNLFIRNFH